MMKSLLVCFFLIAGLWAGAQGFFEQSDAFFATYVKEGKVNYAEIKKNPDRLDEMVRAIATHDISNKRVTKNYLKAFYINAYNILVIDQIVQHYPTKGPLQIEGFFSNRIYEVMGKEVTLDQLEKKILYAQFPDPRLHFVLVCAANGCPPLADFAYMPSSLETTLESRTEYVLNLDWFIRVSYEKVEVSQIFNWYERDFLKSNSSIISFVNQYRRDKVDGEKSIEYYEYDWSLNDLNRK